MSSKQGIIVLPMIFGVSRFHKILQKKLLAEGIQSEIIDIYQNQPFKRKLFFTHLGKNEHANLNELAGKFQSSPINQNIKNAIKRLQGAGVTTIHFWGSSIGAVFAIEYAKKHPTEIASIITWYPNLLFPSTYLPSTNDSLQGSPSLDTLSTPLTIFLGTLDTKLEPATLTYAKQLAEKYPKRVTLKTFNGAGHAFFEKTIQYIFPNIFHIQAASASSLDAALALITQMNK